MAARVFLSPAPRGLRAEVLARRDRPVREVAAELGITPLHVRVIRSQLRRLGHEITRQDDAIALGKRRGREIEAAGGEGNAAWRALGKVRP